MARTAFCITVRNLPVMGFLNSKPVAVSPSHKQGMNAPKLNVTTLNATLTELETLLQQDLSIPQFMEQVVYSISTAIAVERVGIWQHLPHQHVLHLQAGVGWSQLSTPPQLEIAPGSYGDYLLRITQPLIIEDWSQETRFSQPESVQVGNLTPAFSSVSIPLRRQSCLYGILEIQTLRSQMSVNSSEGLIFLRAIGQIITLALERQHLQEMSQQAIQAEAIQAKLRQQINELQAIESVLRESEERYALAVNGSHDGVWDWNLRTNTVYFSAAWKSALGYADHELENKLSEWMSRVHPDDVKKLYQAVDHHSQGLTPQFRSEYRLLHRDGSYRWMQSRGLALRDPYGEARRIAGFQTDITISKTTNDQLRYLALHDQLTGLANRSLFMDRLEHAMQMVRRYPDMAFAVIFLDLDRFKLINDSMGHLVGDQLLITVAERLKKSLRTSDTCARLGGDEFVALLEHIHTEDKAITIIQRIQTELSRPIQLEDREVCVNSSIGIVMSSADYTQPEEFLRDADTAMYYAKASGKGQYAFFTQAMRESAIAALSIESDLRQAIDRQEFELYYQPIVSLRSRRIIGFEALIRWQHPEKGIVMPAEFIRIAEETGLIIPISWWSLKQACQQIRQWQTQYFSDPPLSISVNIARRQFAQADLIAQIQSVLAETGLEPSCLTLEITESAIMENVEHAAIQMNQLKALGVQLCMDDFGTGYSSLSHLHLFPIDILKIDSSFIQQADLDFSKLEIIRTVASLAWNLGIEVVAEGVESNKQVTQLKLLKCELAQGYLFSRPMSADNTTCLLNDIL